MLDTPIRLYTGESTLAQAPAALLIQCGWTALLVFAGRAFWRTNQRKLVIQGG
jgi:ABC-type uncharacterized transport system permease subunit